MPKRVTAAIVDKIANIDAKICIKCGNRTLPVQYRGGIASHFICTKCGLVQVDPSNPFLMSKDPQLYDRRKDTAEIKAKSGNAEEIVIGKITKKYVAPVQRIDTKNIEVEIMVKNPANIQSAINRSLNQVKILEKQRDRDVKLALREKFGRSVPK